MPDESTTGDDGASTARLLTDGEIQDIQDGHHWLAKVHGLVEKYNLRDGESEDELHARQADPNEAPDEIEEFDGNLLVNNGLDRLTNLLLGSGGQAWTNTSCRLGVGNSSTPATVTDADLNAGALGTNRQFETMVATFPKTTATHGQIQLQAIFTTGEANFIWNEWCVDVGAPTVAAGTTVNTMMNHKVIALGTKTSAAAWTFTVTITYS